MCVAPAVLVGQLARSDRSGISGPGTTAEEGGREGGGGAEGGRWSGSVQAASRALQHQLLGYPKPARHDGKRRRSVSVEPSRMLDL